MKSIASAAFLIVLCLPILLGLAVFGRRVFLWLVGKRPWLEQPEPRSLLDQIQFVTNSEIAMQANLRNDDEIAKWREEFVSWAEMTEATFDLPVAYRHFREWRREQRPPIETEEEVIRRVREHRSTENYQAYLKTSHWKQKRAAALEHYHGECQMCGQQGNDVHHKGPKAYAHLGQESVVEPSTVLWYGFIWGLSEFLNGETMR